MADKGAQDKTEKPTPRRRGKAREKGQVAKSQELAGATVLLAGLGSLSLFGQYYYEQISGVMSSIFGQLGQYHLTHENVTGLLTGLAKFAFTIVSPVFLSVCLAAVVANLVQVGFLLALTRLKPDLKKINPLSGFKKFVSMQTFVGLIKNLLKLTVVGAVAYATLAAEWNRVSALSGMDIMPALVYIMDVCFRIFWRCVLALFILAALDWAYQKYEFEKNLKMSKQEVKDEYKQSEGDPQVKARIRSLQREFAKKRMMSSVPEADVVLTNPTHLAVALKYVSMEMDAPTVVAKGANIVAEKIKQAARDAGVPVIEDKPLAQALYKMTEVGQTIPFDLYEAVAAILAHVYRQKNRAREILDAETSRRNKA